MTLNVENTAIWNVRWGSLVEIPCFRGTCLLHIQDSRFSQNMDEFIPDNTVSHPRQ